MVCWCSFSVLNHIYMYMHMQLIHPFEAMKYRKTIRAIRAIGKKCINGRIALLEKGEILPNDILSHILQIASKLLHTSDQSVRNVMWWVWMVLGKEETSDIETLVDDFVVFFIAGK